MKWLTTDSRFWWKRSGQGRVTCGRNTAFLPSPNTLLPAWRCKQNPPFILPGPSGPPPAIRIFVLLFEFSKIFSQQRHLCFAKNPDKYNFSVHIWCYRCPWKQTSGGGGIFVIIVPILQIGETEEQLTVVMSGVKGRTAESKISFLSPKATLGKGEGTAWVGEVGTRPWSRIGSIKIFCLFV